MSGSHLMSTSLLPATSWEASTSTRRRMTTRSGRCVPVNTTHRNLAFAASRWPMRILSAVVQIPTLSMFDLRKDLALRHTVASQLVGHDHPRHILQALQQPAPASAALVRKLLRRL